jgi:hypothetical protein
MAVLSRHYGTRFVICILVIACLLAAVRAEPYVSVTVASQISQVAAEPSRALMMRGRWWQVSDTSLFELAQRLGMRVSSVLAASNLVSLAPLLLIPCIWLIRRQRRVKDSDTTVEISDTIGIGKLYIPQDHKPFSHDPHRRDCN